MKQANQFEIYGSPRTAANTLIYILASATIIGIAVVVPEYLIVKVFFVSLMIFGMFRSVRRVEICDDYIRVDTLFSSFTVIPSDIVKISEHWGYINIWFRGRLGPYHLHWHYIGLQGLQDLTQQLNKLIKSTIN